MSEWAKELWDEVPRPILDEQELYQAQKERRLASFHLDESMLLSCLTGRVGLEMEGLPPGAQIVRITPDFAYLGLRVLVCHPSFEPVPMGNEPPRCGCLWIIQPKSAESKP